MKKIYFYISILIVLLATSCREEDMTPAPALQPGEYLFSVTLPEPMDVTSRTLGEPSAADLSSRKMNVLVFDQNGFFIARRTAEPVNMTSDTEGTFKVNLPAATNKRTLHFVFGLENEDFGTYVPQDNETAVFSSLTVTDRKDAYWQRMEVTEINEDTNLGTINLIRNFAKVTVTVSAENSSFQLEGFDIVNETTAGTVAPYTGNERNGGFADFNNIDNAEGNNYYEKFLSVNPGFAGNNAGNVDDSTPTEFTTDAKYVYERNQDDATNPAYVLIKASYGNKECYYKLDIVTTDTDTYITSYLNLYRNFCYNLNITEVNGAGYDTPEQAMNAVASNNISASVEISQINSIEDGRGNSLTVDELDIMLVTSQPYTLKYKYLINNNENADDEVKVTMIGGSDNGRNPNAVQSIVCNGDGTITITPASSLPATLETQEFIVSTPSRLSRRVTVRVRQPFVFSAVDCDNYVQNVIGASLTLVVRLPDNMPTAAFPLTLDIEPEKKSIYPDVKANRIPVESGDHTFSYKATVTYEDYQQNHALFFHFNTNMAASATNITVTNDYFEQQNNVAEFDNTSETVNGFGTVTLNGAEGTYNFTDYQNQGEELRLAFDLPCQSAEHENASSRPIEIFADYLDFANVDTPRGSYTVRSDGQCIFYTPNDATQRQEIIFKVTQDYASETIQLSALDHRTTTIDYTTPVFHLQVKYYSRRNEQNVPRNSTISIYRDANYSELITTKTTSDSGYITINTFAGFSGNDTLYFSYTRNYNTTYRASVTIDTLTNSGTTTQGAITLYN